VRILGLVPSTKAVFTATLALEESEPVVIHTQRIALPNDDDQSRLLLALLRLVSTVMGEQGCERVVILCAGRSQRGGPSPLRSKVEAVIQLAGVMKDIPVALVAPQSLRAFEKRFGDGAFAGSERCKSKDSIDAARVALLEGTRIESKR